MPTAAEARIQRLEQDMAALQAEITELKTALAGEQREVRASVSGPRLSEVYVDAQAIPMTGWYDRSGKRHVELSPPDVNVFVGVKGQVGTTATLSITINKKPRTETFTLQKQVEYHPFTYPFSHFDL